MAKRVGEQPEDPAEKIVAEYREKVGIYGDFAGICKDLVERLVHAKGIRVHSVTCRVKSVDSLRAKLGGPEERYGALSEVTDLAGVRIITYFSDDVDAIGTVVEREFAVVPDQSIDKRKALDPDRFGYLSLHYVCGLSGARTPLPEYAEYSGYACEIQVRSILQHAWAEIEHDLGYKAAQGIPRAVRRRFSRLAGLLETADDEFMRIRDELAAYASEVKRDIAEKPSEVLLDKVSLAAFMNQDDTVRRVDEQLARYVGAKLEDVSESWIGHDVECLRHVGMNTIEDVRAALVEKESVIVRQWQHRLRGKKHGTLMRGISLFHLWEVLLAEKGDPAEIVAVFAKLDIAPASEREEMALKIIEAVRKASAGESAHRRKRSEEP